jgi:hypothetical protein
MDGSLGQHKANEGRRNERVDKHNQHLEKPSVFEKGHKLKFDFPEPSAEALVLQKESIRIKAARKHRKTALLLWLTLFCIVLLLGVLIFF